jgi:hypothetical protein
MTAPEPITAPGIHDRPSQPAGAPYSQAQLRGIGQAMRWRFLADVLYAVAGIEIFGINPFGFLSAWADDLSARADAAYNIAIGAQSAANYANGQLTLNMTSDVTGGVSISAGFTGAAANNLGAGWNRVSVGSGGGNFGPNGSGQAVWKRSGGLPRAHYDRNTTALATDIQGIRMLVSTRPQSGGGSTSWSALNGNSYNTLLGRMNAAQDCAVFARIGRSAVGIGAIVSGSETILGGTALTVADGDVWTLLLGTDASDREFLLKQNGVVRLAVTDSGAVSQMGGAYRYAGLASEASANLFTQWDTGAVDAWSAVDRQPTTLL